MSAEPVLFSPIRCGFRNADTNARASGWLCGWLPDSDNEYAPPDWTIVE